MHNFNRRFLVFWNCLTKIFASDRSHDLISVNLHKPLATANAEVYWSHGCLQGPNLSINFYWLKSSLIFKSHFLIYSHTGRYKHHCNAVMFLLIDINEGCKAASPQLWYPSGSWDPHPSLFDSIFKPINRTRSSLALAFWFQRIRKG